MIIFSISQVSIANSTGQKSNWVAILKVYLISLANYLLNLGLGIRKFSWWFLLRHTKTTYNSCFEFYL
jgi:uncharacterized membrane protein